MRDFDIIQHEFLGGHDITIVPVFDVHLSNPYCMEQEFIKFIKETAETPNRYLAIGGDLIENGTRSSVGDSVFVQTMTPQEQKEYAANILAPVKDRILCFVPGNHEARSKKDAGLDPMFDIASKLNLSHLYRENIAFLDIQLGAQKEKTDLKKMTKYRVHSKYRPNYMLVVAHGTGGGILTGSAVNRNERFGYVIDGMDILLTGHVHKQTITQPQKIVIDRYHKTVSMVPFKVVSATSWLKYGGYAANKMLLPSGFSLQTITLSGYYKNITVTM